MKLARGLIPPQLAVPVIVVVTALWGWDVVRYLLGLTEALNTTLGTAFASVVAVVLGSYRKKGEAADGDGDGDGGEGDGDGPEPPDSPEPPEPPRNRHGDGEPVSFEEIQRRLASGGW